MLTTLEALAVFFAILVPSNIVSNLKKRKTTYYVTVTMLTLNLVWHNRVRRICNNTQPNILRAPLTSLNQFDIINIEMIHKQGTLDDKK